MKQVMVITGGSRGIGAATARLAAKRGYALCVNYVGRRQAAEDLVVELQANGAEAMAHQADVSSEAAVVDLFESAERALGPITALVNNAGILAPEMRVDQMTADRLRTMFSINVVGAILCAREAIKRMSSRHGGQGGAIVNMSSAAARTGAPGTYVDYAASKGAIDAFTLGLAKEVAAEGVRVNAVRPGFIDTEIHASSGVADRVERVKDTVPMKRGGTAEEVAGAILWLLSDEASYVTGSILDVAGGR